MKTKRPYNNSKKTNKLGKTKKKVFRDEPQLNFKRKNINNTPVKANHTNKNNNQRNQRRNH